MLLALLAVAAPAAQAGYAPGGRTPEACSGAFFSDRIGSLAGEMLASEIKPQRVYGLDGGDWLVGSPTRASCLFGGQGDDTVTLGKGGGIAFGESGRDHVVGSALTDALDGGIEEDVLAGGDGGDVVRGGEDTDWLDGGNGDDLIDATDGLPEIVSCGLGADTVYGDTADVLLGCEKWKLKGPALRHKKLDRAIGGKRTVFGARFSAPEKAPRDRFRAIVQAPGCAGDPITVWSSRRLRRGESQSIKLTPPAGGWCPGAYSGAIVRAPECPWNAKCPVAPPVEPLAWIAFIVR
jgi:hypothetical protein